MSWNKNTWAIRFMSNYSLTLLHSERPKLYTILAFLSAIGLRNSQARAYTVCDFTVFSKKAKKTLDFFFLVIFHTDNVLMLESVFTSRNSKGNHFYISLQKLLSKLKLLASKFYEYQKNLFLIHFQCATITVIGTRKPDRFLFSIQFEILFNHACCILRKY